MENLKSFESYENNPEQNLLKETKNKLTSLTTELKKSLELLNEPLIKDSIKQINTLLSINDLSEINITEKTNILIEKLSLSTNPLAKDLLNVVYLIQLKDFWEVSLDEVKLWIENIIESKNLPKSIKLKTIRWLKNNDYLIWDEFEQVKLQNELFKKYPNYNWFNFEPTTTGEYTNIFTP